MQLCHFSEMAYHPAWPQLRDSYRVVVPSRLYDPKIGADLYHRYLNEWALCDELGINIMTNEHHATATCSDSVCTIPMAAMTARSTGRARIFTTARSMSRRGRGNSRTRRSGCRSQFMNPPGYASAAQSAQAIKMSGAGFRAGRIQSRDGRNIDPRTMTVADAIDAGLVFAGTPDDVFDQLRAFYDHVGGFGHLLMMGQGGLLDHEETVANLSLFSREVLPRLGDLGAV